MSTTAKHHRPAKSRATKQTSMPKLQQLYDDRRKLTDEQYELRYHLAKMENLIERVDIQISTIQNRRFRRLSKQDSAKASGV